MARVAPESISVMDESARTGSRPEQRAGRGDKAADKAAHKAASKAGKVLLKTQPRHAGPWGASFDGRRPDGRPAKGLTFERRWTRPGIHPYDEIAWETRTAAIGNESGKLVFEQKDVEVPSFWSQLATNVVVSKYFRGHVGTPERETSARQLIDRVVNTIAAWAETQHYFASDEDLATFKAELAYLLVHQKMSFNSPVWFNVGIEARPQCSACFINSVQDSMSSIMDLAKTEAMLFKFGSGAGSNLSPIRSSRERMSGGGTASGPVSFMRGYDAFAGVVKSGGKTRRAAKMVILDAGHPDILDFIDSKMLEEKKAWALIEMGYDPSFTGEAYGSVSFQNANHSVRVTDEFMNAIEADGEWTTHAVVDGSPMGTYKARDIFKRMADAAHLCGDPGIQYDTTINDWHTSANSDRIYASNPCVTGATLVATDAGWRRIDSLVGTTANIIGSDGQPHPVERIFATGTKPIFELKTRSGYRVQITADHLVATTRGDVAVKDLRADDRIFLNSAGFGADTLPVELGEAIGLAVGDGYLSHQTIDGREFASIVLTMQAQEAGVLEAVAAELNSQKRLLKVAGSSGRNDNVNVTVRSTGARLAFASRPVVDLFLRYAVLDEGADLKRFTDEAFGLDRSSLAAILRGLFSADGTVANYGDKSQHVALDSTSLDVLLQVQRMLLGFGIKARIYENRRGGQLTSILPDGKGGSKAYPVREMHSLRITSASRLRFEREIGFVPESPKAAALARLNASVGTYSDELVDEFGSVTAMGEADVYDLTELTTSHFVANGLVVHNCSEYMFLNDTACNLASLNLLQFVREDGEFDVESYRYAARLTITAQEILVDNASYPTQRIEENSHRFRPLGLGYANLGALLMSRGLAYDSDEGRNYAAALTAIMHGEAFRQSAVIARDHGGPFHDYAINEGPFLRVIGKHRDAAYQIPTDQAVPADMIQAARVVFDDALELGRAYGYRNAQVTVLAPTGTIAFMMDCDTTGIEPDIALIKYKKLVGEGFLKIVNQTVPAALKKLGYAPEQVEEILAYINERETIEGAPHLKAEHLSVFDCAFKPVNGERSIDYMGHVRMMAAVQPFLSGAISKTVNMPEAATPEQIQEVYLQGWKLGLKAIAIYRDGSKRSQPLSTGKKKDAGEEIDTGVVAELRAQLAIAQAEAKKPHRHRLPVERAAVTHKFDVAGHEGYITVGLYPDGQPGEIFLKMAKEGSTVSGLMDSLATSVSMALQYGVPLHDLVNKFAHVRFEPSGFTGNQEIPIAKSIVDYVFRWMGSRFLPADERAQIGLIDRAAVVDSAPVSFGPVSLAVAPEADTPTVAEERDDDPPSAVAVETAAVSIKLPVVESIAHTATGNGHSNGNGNGNGYAAPGASLGATRVTFKVQEDSPSCAECGSIMVRNGSCYKCLNCGSTSGCS